jgi:hypothetical protein
MEQYAIQSRDRNVTIESNDSYNQVTLHSHDNQSLSSINELNNQSSVETLAAGSLNKSESFSNVRKETTARNRNISFNISGRHDSNKIHQEEDFGRAHTLDELFHYWNVLYKNKKLDEEFKREYEVGFCEFKEKYMFQSKAKSALI